MLSSPVVYIMFNRLECVKKTFPIIRTVQPKQLFVISDGPRDSLPEDRSNVQACRTYIDEAIDWKCEVFRIYREENLGCGKSIANGLDSVFSIVEQAIILEDDIKPDPTFFNFCQVLLEYYKDYEQVYCITGRNPHNIWKPEEKPYFFTHNLSQLGWATWRRAWQEFQFSIRDWGTLKNRRSTFTTYKSLNDGLISYFLFNGLFFNPREDAWGYQWLYTCLKNDGLCIMPSKNLTAHIGAGQDATHTKNWEEYVEVFSVDTNLPFYRNPLPDREFQKLGYRKLATSEKRKMLWKLMKNEIKFLFKMNKF